METQFLQHVFLQCRIHTSTSLSPSNAIRIRVTFGWLMFKGLKGPVSLSSITPLQISVNHGLKRVGTAKVLGIIVSAMSSKLKVKKDMGSSVSVMAD